MQKLIIWGILALLLMLPGNVASSDVTIVPKPAPCLQMLLEGDQVYLVLKNGPPGLSLAVQSSPSLVPLDEYNEFPPWNSFHWFVVPESGTYKLCLLQKGGWSFYRLVEADADDDW